MAVDFEKTASELKQNLDSMKRELVGLRDEIRLKLHLGGMELRDQWKKLEPAVTDIERHAMEVSDASREAMGDLVKRFRALRDTLESKARNGPPSA